MITVKCINNTCPNSGIDYNVLGTHDFVECGGCGVHLEPYDQRDDPEIPSPFSLPQD